MTHLYHPADRDGVRHKGVSIDGDHGRTFAESSAQVCLGDDFDHPGPRRTHGSVILIAIALLNEHLIGHARGVG